jgi:hypothetical protein
MKNPWYSEAETTKLRLERAMSYWTQRYFETTNPYYRERAMELEMRLDALERTIPTHVRPAP